MTGKGALAMPRFLPRFRVRTLMITVAVVALLLAAIGPGRQWYRRWSYYRSESAMFARLEGTARMDHARESQASADREAIRLGLMKSPEFAAMSTDERERIIDNVVASHRQQAEQALAAARSWAEKRRDSETAAIWAFDPFAPDVP
jgi:hypothetical protein